MLTHSSCFKLAIRSLNEGSSTEESELCTQKAKAPAQQLGMAMNLEFPDHKAVLPPKRKWGKLLSHGLTAC